MKITFLQVPDVCKKMRNVFKLNSECYLTFGQHGELICSVVDLHFKGCLAFLFRSPLQFRSDDDSSSATTTKNVAFMLKCDAWTVAMDVLAKRNGRRKGKGNNLTKNKSDHGQKKQQPRTTMQQSTECEPSTLWLEFDEPSQTVSIGVDRDICAESKPQTLKSSFFANIYQRDSELLPAKWAHKLTIHAPLQFDTLCKECCEINDLMTLELVVDRFVCRASTAPNGPGRSVIEFTWPTHPHQKLLSYKYNKTTSSSSNTNTAETTGTYALRVLRACTDFCYLVDQLTLYFGAAQEEAPLYVAGSFKGALLWVSRLFRENM